MLFNKCFICAVYHFAAPADWTAPNSPITPMAAPSSASSLSHVARYEALETEFNRDWSIVYSRVRLCSCTLPSQSPP